MSASNRNEFVAGAMLTFKLFDGMKGRRAAAALSYEAQALDSQAIQQVRVVGTRLANIKSELRLNHELVEAAKERIKQGQRYLKLTLSEYKRGIKNAPDVLEATDRFFEFKQKFSELRRNYELAIVDLLSMVGK